MSLRALTADPDAQVVAVLLTGSAEAGPRRGDHYRRLAHDRRALGRTVLVDMCGSALRGALAGGVEPQAPR